MTLDKLIDGLERLADRLEGKSLQKMLNKLCEYGVKYAKEGVINVDTGETQESIKGRVEGNKIIIEAGGKAVWLEFGTGISHSDYPGPLPDGIYEHGGYGKGLGGNPDGWYYPITGDNYNASIEGMSDPDHPPYWDHGVLYVHTYGIEPNLFMWNTIEAMEKKAVELGLELISTELKAI